MHLAVRATHEDVALTIYPTGRWRIAVGEAVSRWTRPKEFRPGWTRGPDLVIPFTAAPVRTPSDDPHAAEPLTWLPPAAPGYHARFSLLIATPSAEASHWRPLDAAGTQSVATLPLRTAGTLHLYRVDEPADPEHSAGPGRLLPESPPVPPPAAASEWLPFSVIVSADQTGCPSFRESHGL